MDSTPKNTKSHEMAALRAPPKRTGGSEDPPECASSREGVRRRQTGVVASLKSGGASPSPQIENTDQDQAFPGWLIFSANVVRPDLRGGAAGPWVASRPRRQAQPALSLSGLAPLRHSNIATHARGIESSSPLRLRHARKCVVRRSGPVLLTRRGTMRHAGWRGLAAWVWAAARPLHPPSGGPPTGEENFETTSVHGVALAGDGSRPTEMCESGSFASGERRCGGRSRGG